MIELLSRLLLCGVRHWLVDSAFLRSSSCFYFPRSLQSPLFQWIRLFWVPEVVPVWLVTKRAKQMLRKVQKRAGQLLLCRPRLQVRLGWLRMMVTLATVVVLLAQSTQCCPVLLKIVNLWSLLFLFGGVEDWTQGLCMGLPSLFYLFIFV